ncbi:MAG TPA: MarR family transcriptional regulator [Solirubrobacteraceae bacterium]|nr:MarR family transcriptional regulator [Solirubrobacteraceae bacterium]
MKALRDEDYRRLLAFRIELRDFLRWSEQSAHAAGLTPALHQLLLAVRGHDRPEDPTIGEVAEMLHMRHHSMVELAQRAEAAGLVQRLRDSRDQRRMHLLLTDEGRAQLESLTRAHLPRIHALARALDEVIDS